MCISNSFLATFDIFKSPNLTFPSLIEKKVCTFQISMLLQKMCKDMTFIGQKKEIFCSSGNIPICQNVCSFKYYNKTTKKAKCDCEPQRELTETNIIQITFGQSFISGSFLRTLKNSNFLVLKCYNLAFIFSFFLEISVKLLKT